MNVPIFFFGYLVGYLLTAYCLDEGVTVYQGHPEEWQLRKVFWYRAITSPKYGRLGRAVLALSWPYLLLGALIHVLRQKPEEPFDFNRLRHCSDPLYQWCDTPYTSGPMYFRNFIESGSPHFCEAGDHYNWCTTSLLVVDNRCTDLEYDPQMCQGVALQ